MPTKTGKNCTACGGNIVEDLKPVPSPFQGQPIFGPGSREQLKMVDHVVEYYCEDCGLMYKFPPKK